MLSYEELLKGLIDDIEDLASENVAFRRVLYTAEHPQLVLITQKPVKEIGAETHVGHDQFFRVEKGKGEVWIDGKRSKIKRDEAIIVRADASQNITNTGSRSPKLYTLHASPRHHDSVVRTSKAGAAASDEHFEDKTKGVAVVGQIHTSPRL